MKKRFEEGKKFLIKAQDTSTREFLIYLCIDFSFLINGLLLVCMGILPALIENSSENVFRFAVGDIFIAIWFIFLPNVSMKTKDKIANHFAWAFISLVILVVVVTYWIFNGTKSLFSGWDILIVLVSIPVVAYLIFLLTNLFKLVFLAVKTVVNRIIPEVKNKERGLIFTLEAITSIFVTLSSLVAAFWGLITAFKNIV